MESQGKIVSLRLVGAPDPQWPSEFVVGKRVAFEKMGGDRTVTVIAAIQGGFAIYFGDGLALCLHGCPVAVIREPVAPADNTNAGKAVKG